MRDTSSTIRVLIADGEPLYAVGIEKTLKDKGFFVVGIVAQPGMIEAEFKRQAPDLLICDAIFGNELTGLLSAKNILLENPDAQIIFLSSCLKADVIKKSYEIGGKAYLSKSISADDLMTAVDTIWQAPNDIYYSSDIASLVGSYEFSQAKSKAVSPQSILSERELDIFRLVASGHTQPEIAQELGLHPRTIASDVAQIKEKLGVSRPASLTMMAIKHELIKLSNTP